MAASPRGWLPAGPALPPPSVRAPRGVLSGVGVEDVPYTRSCRSDSATYILIASWAGMPCLALHAEYLARSAAVDVLSVTGASPDTACLCSAYSSRRSRFCFSSRREVGRYRGRFARETISERRKLKVAAVRHLGARVFKLNHFFAFRVQIHAANKERHG
jgi:hypothetical protein